MTLEELPPRIRAIVVQETAAFSILLKRNLTVDDVLNGRHRRDLAHVRWAIWYRMRDKEEPNSRPWSLIKIANLFDTDHTNILHGIRGHEKRLPEWAAAKQRLYENQRRDHGNMMAAAYPDEFKALAYDPA